MDTPTIDTPTTTTTTPSSSTPSAPVTSATGTTPIAPAAVERPGNVRQLSAFMQKLETGATPTSPTIPASPETATIAPGVIDPKPGDVLPPTPQGPIPFDVHHTALANAREKAIAEYRQKYGWAERIPEQKLQEWSGIAQKMTADPIAFVSDFITQLESHPIWGPKLQAATASAQPAVAAPDKPRPDVEIRNEQGQVVGMTYSDAQLEKKLAFEHAEWAKTQDARLQPLMTAEQRRQEDAQQAETSRQLNQAADHRMERMARMLDIPKGDLKHALWQHVATVWTAHPDWEPEDVALEVRATAIQPAAAQRAQEQVAADMRKKAAGNTANGQSPVTTITKPKNVSELAALMRELEGAAG